MANVEHISLPPPPLATMTLQQINTDPAIMRQYTPDHQLTHTYVAGLLSLEAGNLDAALTHFQAENAGSPCYGLSLGNCGQILLHLDRLQQAEEYCERALAEFDANGCPHPPSGAQFARNSGEILARQGRYAKASTNFNRAVLLTRQLIKDHPDLADALELESGHIFNSWGSALLEFGRMSGATDCFRKALDIYKKHPGQVVGLAETLTNYALTLTSTGRLTESSLALREALQVATTSRNDQQIRRVQIAMIKLDPSLVPDAYAVLDEASAEASEAGMPSDAYVRLCIKADVASKRGDYQVGLDAIKEMTGFESQLDQDDPNPAKMRFAKAELMAANGAPPDEVLCPLIEGAEMWFQRLRRPLSGGDFLATAQAMHSHFRLLSRTLLEMGRTAEALAVFEMGRAIGYAVAVDGVTGRILGLSLFKDVQRQIDCSLVEQVQSTLRSEQAILILAPLPPKFVAFVVQANCIEVVEVLLPSDETEASRLFDEVSLIPFRLQEGVGERSIPELISTFARKIATAINGKTVITVHPSNLLHKVPWRALLHSFGIPWNQLPLTIGYGFLVRQSESARQSGQCRALGYGNAGIVDLNEEARSFAMTFGSVGQVLENCRSEDIRAALSSNEIVFISCHGNVVRQPDSGENRLFLDVQDGRADASEGLLPERVAARLVILSACHSGVYEVEWGDHPVGFAPDLIQKGAEHCLCARYEVNSNFSHTFFNEFGGRIASGEQYASAFSAALQTMDAEGFDLWRDLACFELLGKN